MVYIYVIESARNKYRYVGITNNIERRMQQHNEGRNKSTKPYAPFVLKLIETYNTYATARQREKFLKSGVGRKFLNSLK